MCSWEPSLRVTPDQALKHAWIHEPWNLKAQPRLQTLRKASLCFPSEARKGKVQGQHHLGKQGTVPQIASPISLIQGVRRLWRIACQVLWAQPWLIILASSLLAWHFLIWGFSSFRKLGCGWVLLFFCPLIIRNFRVSPISNSYSPPFLFFQCVLLCNPYNYLLNFYHTDYGIMQISFICHIASRLCPWSLESGCLG